MKNGKTLGVDGFPAEFFKFLWRKLKILWSKGSKTKTIFEKIVPHFTLIRNFTRLVQQQLKQNEKVSLKSYI